MPTMILPLMTGLILFFSGIVIGYLFTYRDRSGEDELRDKLIEENERLKQETFEQRCVNDELEDQLRERQSKITLLQQVCDELESEQHTYEKRYQKLESELSSAQLLTNEVRKLLADESRYRNEANDLLHDQQQKHLQELANVENQWREKISRSEALIVQRDQELSQLKVTNARISEQLNLAETENAKLDSELRNHRAIIETAKQNANGLEREYVSLESSMQTYTELLNEARGKVAAAELARNLAQEALEDLRGQYRAQLDRITKLEQQSSDLSATKLRCSVLEQSLENANQRMTQIIAERDAALEAEKKALILIGGLQKRTENQEITLRSVREQIVDRDNKISDLLARAEHFQTALEQARQVHLISVEAHADTQREMSLGQVRVQELEARIQGMEAAQEEWQTRASHLVAQRDQAFHESLRLRGQIDQISAEIKEHKQTILSLRDERDRAIADLQKAQLFPRISHSLANNLVALQKGTRLDPVRGVIYTEPPSDCDDLKQISGIAEVLEKRLNNYGIYTFKQIMDWDQTAIDEFSILLAFKDRIRRDDWKGQAARLYHAKVSGRDQGRAA
ncbi:MAG TPA: hypothetical protein PKD64_13795 [Pirellulaceae bacterium]|nr:hypothetical protein [Pirellulaceae bacterium]HMO93259.1 hypothetical protein [Pirellulaceae bacterium]HMP69124.1 hypothetical protein [Pirellulaceae bacterium]